VRPRIPKRYLEIGSGNSTKIVVRASRGGALDTHITSIDPHPRAEIGRLCHHIVRAPLETADLSIFDALKLGDTAFFDGSHRAFMASDAVVFFVEISYLLAEGSPVTPLLSCHYVSCDPQLSGILAPPWAQEQMRGVDKPGFTWWLATQGQVS